MYEYSGTLSVSLSCVYYKRLTNHQSSMLNRTMVLLINYTLYTFEVYVYVCVNVYVNGLLTSRPFFPLSNMYPITHTPPAPPTPRLLRYKIIHATPWFRHSQRPKISFIMPLLILFFLREFPWGLRLEGVCIFVLVCLTPATNSYTLVLFATSKK